MSHIHTSDKCDTTDQIKRKTLGHFDDCGRELSKYEALVLIDQAHD